MKNLRYSILALLFSLTFLFNIERLDFQQEALINLQTFTYILTLIAVLVVISSYRIFSLRVGYWLIFWTAVYVVWNLWVADDRQFFGGLNTYLTITELTLMLINVAFARQVGGALRDFEIAVEDLTLSESGSRVAALKDAIDTISVEFARGRRHRRPITVVVIDPIIDPEKDQREEIVKELQEAMMNRYIINSLARRLNNLTRRSDLVFEHPDKRKIVFISPETDEEQAKDLIRRLRNVAAGAADLRVSIGVSTFPKQAITFGELLEQAESSLQPIENIKDLFPVEVEGSDGG